MANAAYGAPRVPATVIERELLLRRLREWPDITVVHGPFGSGKTTLLAAWAHTERRVFWCEPTERRLPLPQIESFASNGAGVVVVDGCENIEPDDLRRLGQLIDRASQLRVAFASRNGLLVETLGASSDAAIDVISAADLRMTDAELHGAGLFSTAERERVLKRTGGHAMAVRASIDEHLGHTHGLRIRLTEQLRRALAADPATLTAALQLSLLSRANASTLAAWSISDERIQALGDAGVLERDGQWVCIQPFFRDLLRPVAEKVISRADRSRLISAAIREGLVDDDPVAALGLAIEIDDLTLATDVILAKWVELLGMREATYSLLTSAPMSRYRGFPAITVLLVVIANADPDTRPRARQLLASEALLQRIRRAGGSERDRAIFRAFEAAVSRLTPQADRALGRVQRAVADLEALSEADSASLGRLGPMLHTHLGIAAMYLCDIATAQQCFSLADAAHVEAGRADRVDPLSLRGGLAALMGDLPLARRLLDEADALPWPDGWRTSSPADFFHLGRAVLALEDGRPSLADEHLAAVGDLTDLIEHWQLFALVTARRDRLAGAWDAGLVRLRHVRERRSGTAGTQLARSIVRAAEAELLLASGDAARARGVAVRSASHSDTGRLVLARTELALARPAEAAVQASRVLSGECSPRCRLDAELILMVVAHRSDDHEAAVAGARRVVELARLTGLRSPFRTVDRQDRAALHALLGDAGLDAPVLAVLAAENAETVGDEHARVTPRERAVLEALVDTGAVDTIASAMFVSRNTVKSQLRSLYRKLGVSSREAALSRAAVLGLMEARHGQSEASARLRSH